MDPRRAVIAVGIAAGAVVVGAMFTSPVANADDDQLLSVPYYPGLVGPIGGPTNVVNMNDLLFLYHQEVDLDQVRDGANVIGQFTDTNTTIEPALIPGDPFLTFGLLYGNDVISDSTYPGLADGASQQFLGLVFASPDFLPFAFLANNFVDNPGIATSDVLTVLNLPIQLWDIPADPAAGADLAALF
jgi:hypothetical protein